MMTKKKVRGFSLLEVLVAIALLAISFSLLFWVQARNTKLALQARSINLATQLARFQLQECKREAIKKIPAVSDFKLEGDFSDLGHPEMTWECHAPRFNMKAPSASQVQAQAKKAAGKDSQEANSANMGMATPFLAMITDTLGQSVRELAVIVRYEDAGFKDEVRVVTHVIDTAAMTGLSRMLEQGAASFSKQTPGKGTDVKSKDEPKGEASSASESPNN